MLLNGAAVGRKATSETAACILVVQTLGNVWSLQASSCRREGSAGPDICMCISQIALVRAGLPRHGLWVIPPAAPQLSLPLPTLTPFLCDQRLQTPPEHQMLLPGVHMFTVFLKVIPSLCGKHCCVRVLPRGRLEPMGLCLQDRGALHWAAKPGLEQAAGESPGLECFWVWGWRAEGGNGRGRRAAPQASGRSFGSAVGRRRGPQSCLRATRPPLLETGGRCLTTLTYHHRTGCSK